jgi:hypothetical protein
MIVGWYTDVNFTYHGFLRNPDGTITSFDGGPNGTEPTAINPAGRIVGSYSDQGGIIHGFLLVIKR